MDSSSTADPNVNATIKDMLGSMPKFVAFLRDLVSHLEDDPTIVDDDYIGWYARNACLEHHQSYQFLKHILTDDDIIDLFMKTKYVKILSLKIVQIMLEIKNGNNDEKIQNIINELTYGDYYAFTFLLCYTDEFIDYMDDAFNPDDYENNVWKAIDMAYNSMRNCELPMVTPDNFRTFRKESWELYIEIHGEYHCKTEDEQDFKTTRRVFLNYKEGENAFKHRMKKTTINDYELCLTFPVSDNRYNDIGDGPHNPVVSAVRIENSVRTVYYSYDELRPDLFPNIDTITEENGMDRLMKLGDKYGHPKYFTVRGGMYMLNNIVHQSNVKLYEISNYDGCDTIRFLLDRKFFINEDKDAPSAKMFLVTMDELVEVLSQLS
jgi:hypothetical protein